MIRTRFAPSPTGDLHVGGAFTALASFALGGERLLRMEDIDAPRVVPGSAERIREDLAWLGFAWDTLGEPPDYFVQSTRIHHYDAALTALAGAGLTYPCDCSRSELARIASAPHAGEELRYPGLCRDKEPTRDFKRPPALRLRVPEAARVRFVDQLTGTLVSQQVDREVGDFVLRRGDGSYAYQLAVAVDDAAMGVTHVVRGRDLLGSTARQILLQTLLGCRPIEYWLHVPLVTLDAERMAKRLRNVSIRALRQAGFEAERIVGELAFGLGLAEHDEPRTLASVRCLPEEASRRLRRTSFEVPDEWVQALFSAK